MIVREDYKSQKLYEGEVKLQKLFQLLHIKRTLRKFLNLVTT